MANEISKTPTQAKLQVIPLSKIHDLPSVFIAKPQDKSLGSMVLSIESSGVKEDDFLNEYEQKKQERIDRLRERADKARAQSDALSRQSWNMIHAIPGGQPIMGSADARYRERADNKMRQSVAVSDKADYYERRAQAAENNTAISSDDPEAIAKLTEKLEGLKQTQEFMKAVNAYYKKNGTCQGFPGLSDEEAAKLGRQVKKGEMSEWYVRDCSRKQKAQYQIRGKSGKPVTNTIPYGFKKDPGEKHHWLVDEEAADVVRRIFHLSAEGKGPQTIAKILMMDKVERPSYYLARQGRGTCQRKTDMSRPYDWTGNTIADMLAKPEYMGHTVNFRAYKPSYKDKKMIKRPPEEWLIFLVWIKKMQGQKCRHVSTFGLFFATYLNYVQSLECYRPILSTVRIVVVFVDIAELENNHSIF